MASPLNPPKRILLGPGPSNPHPRVLEALSAPVVGHLDPEFFKIMEESKAMLRRLFHTENDLTFPVSGTGSAGMETCLVNLVEEGDTVLVCVNGVFGTRMADIVERLGGFGIPGTSVDNPIDIPVWGLKSDDTFIFHEIVELLAADDGVDSIIAYVEMNSIFEFSDDVAAGEAEMEAIVRSLLRADTAGIALSAVLRTAGDKVQDDILRAARPRLLENGIAVFPTTARAIRAHALMTSLSGSHLSV